MNIREKGFEWPSKEVGSATCFRAPGKSRNKKTFLGGTRVYRI